MSLDAGDRLGRYEILGPLGAGGMGEVNRARDTELERDVAIKVLPEAVAQDPERLERFEREARAIAKLSHPNILEIYDFGREGEVAYAVTELLEGETLRERIGSRPTGWHEAATIGAEIADGLVAAHGRGVIHRDLKPANIFLTSDGRVKILDFGLARLTAPARSEEETEALESTLTSDGAVLGTVGYMSPEQVRGQPADHRSDIFSLGCVLYEMVGGRRAFEADSGADTMAAILTEEPEELSALGAEAPPDLERLIHRCLDKTPDSRFQSAADLAFALRTAVSVSGVRRPELAVPVPERQTRRDLLAAAAGALVMGALVTGVAVLIRDAPPAPRPPFRFTIPLPEAETLPRGLALSPDGTRLVWAGSRLYHRRLDRLEELEPIPDTEFATHPFFSPDGQWLGFHSADGKLTIMPVDGGVRTVLADSHFRSRATWSADDSIVFTNPEGGISRISAHGGEPTVLTTADPGDTAFHQAPQLLPGEQVLLYVVYTGDPRVMALRLGTGEEAELTQGRTSRYLSSGHLAFMTRPGVVARPFDPDRVQFTGPPRPVLGGIWPRDQIAVSETGRDIWVLPTDEETPYAFLATPAEEGLAMFSPDGRRIAYSSDRSGTYEIYATDFPDAARTIQISTDGGRQALWAPDGRTIYYQNGDRVMAVPITYEPSFDAGKPEVLFTGNPANPGVAFHVNDITADGERFLMVKSDPGEIVVVTDWVEELERLAPTD